MGFCQVAQTQSKHTIASADLTYLSHELHDNVKLKLGDIQIINNNSLTLYARITYNMLHQKNVFIKFVE